jgi:hypothetical protein
MIKHPSSFNRYDEAFKETYPRGFGAIPKLGYSNPFVKRNTSNSGSHLNKEV